jgi:hypothetical protein
VIADLAAPALWTAPLLAAAFDDHGHVTLGDDADSVISGGQVAVS